MAKTMIAYFSRADENYFSGSMRYVTTGTTEIVVNKIRELIDADTFKIEMKRPYSPAYFIRQNEPLFPLCGQDARDLVKIRYGLFEVWQHRVAVDHAGTLPDRIFYAVFFTRVRKVLFCAVQYLVGTVHKVDVIDAGQIPF